jgi:hypothetical protein
MKTSGTHSDGVSVVFLALWNFQKSEGLHVAVQAQPQTAGCPTSAMRKAPLTPAPASGVCGELDQLLAAAMRCCDYCMDGPEARAQMVADICGTPQHHRQELLEHFLVAYGQAK